MTENKCIVLTGASSGIGRATALMLGRAKTKLFLVSRRRELLESLAREVKSTGGIAHIVALDLSRSEHVHRMMREAHETLGRIDVLINNAGFGYFGTVEHTPPDVVREIFALNFEAPLIASQLAIPLMRSQGSGHIINVSSVAGKRGLPLTGIYSATKFALNGLSEALRVEVDDANIMVSTICPAGTRTEFGDAIRKGDVTGSFKPLGHSQSAEEVARSIVRFIERPKVEVYPYWAGRIFAWASTISPSLVDAVVSRSFRQRLRSRTEEPRD
jgi:short-subunit dehydrogenase